MIDDSQTQKFSLTPELLEAYRRTEFVVKRKDAMLVLKVGVFNAGIKSLFEEMRVTSSAFITAFNPYSINKSDEDNQRRQFQLTAEIAHAGYQQIEGYGQGAGDGHTWSEESILVLNITYEEAMSYAQKYQQHAFVWISSDCVPLLVVSSDSTV